MSHSEDDKLWARTAHYLCDIVIAHQIALEQGNRELLLNALRDLRSLEAFQITVTAPGQVTYNAGPLVTALYGTLSYLAQNLAAATDRTLDDVVADMREHIEEQRRANGDEA